VLYTGFSVNFVREMSMSSVIWSCQLSAFSQDRSMGCNLRSFAAFCAAYFGTYELAKRALLGSSILFPLNNSSAPRSLHATSTDATLAQAIVGPKDHSLGSLAAVQLVLSRPRITLWLCADTAIVFSRLEVSQAWWDGFAAIRWT
jgi:hypothetical protein